MKICVMTLGCKVNKYESDVLANKLEKMGYETTDKLEYADIFVINTCAVTAEAEKKSRQMIARCKKFNPNAKILVCGCASQRDTSQFKTKGAEIVIGNASKLSLAEAIINNDFNDKGLYDLPLAYEHTDFAKQYRTRAYIKIQDGCNNFCTYCIIPYLRGRSRSRDLESIIEEAKNLSEDVKEIVLTGINVTDFKIDDKPGLLRLLQQLDIFNKRLRLSSLEETLVSEEFISGLAKLNSFCPHFHLSLQSGCDTVLKRMNRKYTAKDFESSVQLIRKYFPLSAITTDVIVGFPEESDAEFKETCQFIKKIKFASLHIFKYSRREGTVACRYNDLPDNLKSQRSDVLEGIKAQLQKDFLTQNIASNATFEVLVEKKENSYYVGYTKNYIKCYLHSEKSLINQVVSVKLFSIFNDGVKAKIC